MARRKGSVCLEGVKGQSEDLELQQSQQPAVGQERSRSLPSRLPCSPSALHLKVVKALAEMCVELHTSVEEASARFYAQLRRR